MRPLLVVLSLSGESVGIPEGAPKPQAIAGVVARFVRQAERDLARMDAEFRQQVERWKKLRQEIRKEDERFEQLLRELSNDPRPEIRQIGQEYLKKWEKLKTP